MNSTRAVYGMTMNLAITPRLVRREFDVKLASPVLTVGRSWSGELQADCVHEVHTVIEVQSQVSTLTNVDDIPIGTYFTCIVTPVGPRGKRGRRTTERFSSKELGADFTLELTSLIRSVMREDQAAMLANV